MSEKKRSSVSIDADLLDEVQRRDELNLSGVVNDFLRSYLAHGSTRSATLEARLQHLKERKERLHSELEDINSEIEHLEETLEVHEQQRSEEEEQLQHLAQMLPDELSPDNPAVQNWANKLDRRPSEVIEMVDDFRKNGHSEVATA